MFFLIFFSILICCGHFKTASTSNKSDDHLKDCAEYAQNGTNAVQCFLVEHPSGPIVIKIYNTLLESHGSMTKNLYTTRQVLQKTDVSMALHHETLDCHITMSNEQFLDLFDIFATKYAMNKDQHAGFIEILASNRLVQIDGIMATRSSQMNKNKFLPFELDRILDILEARITQNLQKIPTLNLTFEISDECLPPLNQNGTELGEKKEDQDKMFSREYCEQKNNTEMWYCDATTKMSKSKRDILMMALFTALYIDLDRITSVEREVIASHDFEVCSYTKFTNLYGENVAELHAEFGLRECCKIAIARPKIYGTFSLEGFQRVEWECHDPYKITNLISNFITDVSFILVLFSPFILKFFPTNKEVEPAQVKRFLSEMQETRNFGKSQRYVAIFLFTT